MFYHYFDQQSSLKRFINKHKEKKEEIWLSPMTKAPTPTEMSKGQSDNTNNATKTFDFSSSWQKFGENVNIVQDLVVQNFFEEYISVTAYYLKCYS